MKKSAKISIIVVLVSLLLLALRLFLGGPEDTWFCRDGQWTKHGNPSSTKPNTPCGDEKLIGGDKDEYGCLIGAGYSWCPSTEKCQRMWAEYCEEYKDQYVETVLPECISYSIEECPSDCVVCPPCPECSDFLCQSSSFCREEGFDNNWYGAVKDGVDNFAECVALGNPIMESYPRQCQAEGKSFTEEIVTQPEDKSDMIILDEPQPETKVTSPLLISGQARGQWFFEATFPVILTNWDGLIIAEGYATAKEDWMTEEFVPFEATLEFTADTSVSDRGALILKKNNPSGLPENDDALEITVFFNN